MEEIWKAVKGYEGYYEVSNLGKVRSLDRIITDKRGFKKPLKGRMLKLKFNRDGGYLIVILCKNCFIQILFVYLWFNIKVAFPQLVGLMEIGNHMDNTC